VFESGETTSTQFTVPTEWAVAQGAPSSAPGDLEANLYGNSAQLRWSPAPGADQYVVSLFDAYSGRSLGIQYQTTETAIELRGLPLGTTVQVYVQVCPARGLPCSVHAARMAACSPHGAHAARMAGSCMARSGPCCQVVRQLASKLRCIKPTRPCLCAPPRPPGRVQRRLLRPRHRDPRAAAPRDQQLLRLRRRLQPLLR
jgi:hypothetical protein